MPKAMSFPTDQERTSAAALKAVTGLGYRVESADNGLLKFQSNRSWRVSHGLDVTATFLPDGDGTRVNLDSRVARPGTPFGSGRSTAGALGEDGKVSREFFAALSALL